MANTEGISDEALQCLLGDEPMSSLQRRMEMPMSDKPAARVIRSSGRPEVQESSNHSPASLSQEPIENDKRPPLLIGNVVERVRRPRTIRSPLETTSTRKPSRFAMTKRHATGFPSLQNKPLGSLVVPKSPATTTVAHDPINDQVETTTASDHMIAQMSPAEIRESQQELHHVLSPETIQFLKQRGQSQSQQQKQTDIITPPENTKPTVKTAVQHDNEKERVATLLSSVKNYDDMDALYRQEMGTAMNETEETISDFATACRLLRSSVPRQNLWAVRHVEQCLRDAVVEQTTTHSYSLGTSQEWPYPVVLPVALRCLLDMNSSTSIVGGQIQAHALIALYYLTRLRVPVDYVAYDISTGDLQSTAAHLYHEYLLDDAVPTCTFQYASTNQMQPIAHSTAAYATSSSTTSAHDDGEAFQQDPIWTLLSRMKIIPWISNWLKQSHVVVPTDAVRAAIGLLVFLVQRSPGAATAVVQHSSLLADVAKQDVGSAVLLQCVAARQSRPTASVVAMSSDQTIQNLISLQEIGTSESNYKQHKWTIVLWRTLLRYGMAVDALPSVLNLAAKHIVLGSDLSCYLFSAFSSVLNCIVAANKSPKDVSMGENRDGMVIISTGDRALLANAGSWLSATRRQALRHVENLEESLLAKSSRFDDSNLLEKLQFYSSVFRFLASWTRMSESLAAEPRDGEFKAEEITESEEVLCMNAVLLWLKYDTLREVVGIALAGLIKSESSSLDSMSLGLSKEAACCSFTESLLEFLSTLTGNGLHEAKSSPALQSIHELLTEIIAQNFISETSTKLTGARCDEIDRSRRFWLNRAHSAYLKFLSWRGWDLNGSQKAIGTVSLINVIGHLDVGEESTAAILFSCDQLLRTSTRGDSNGHSILSSWFVRSLCVTPAGRAQLDHSFKLRGGSGISADRYGPFEIQSLLSTVPSSTSATDNVLPLGHMWLWKSLAGAVIDSSGADEALAVLLSTLELSFDLEGREFKESSFGTTKSAGARFYYLMNLSMQSEDILADTRIQFAANRLIDLIYQGCIDSSFVVGFAEECESHNSVKKNGLKSETGEPLHGNTKLSKLIDPPKVYGETMSSSCINSLASFVNDICDSFVESGAQFEFCKKCMYFFFSSCFPSKIKCNVIQRCIGTLHLITVDTEDDMRRFLRHCLLGGISYMDNSDRDTPDVLDAAVSVLSQEGTAGKHRALVISWAIAVLLRDLTGCLFVGENLLGCKRRMLSIPENYRVGILNRTPVLAQTEGKVDDIIFASIIMQCFLI